MDYLSQQDKSDFKELAVIFLTIILLSSSLFSMIPAFAGVSFSAVTTLNQTAANSQNPQVAANNSDGVYVVWHGPDTSGNINFSASDDNGTSFAVSDVKIGDNTGNSNEVPFPQVAANSTDGVYAVWQNATKIRFSASSNGGTSFNTASIVKIGTAPSGNTANPQIAASGDNVYVVWRETAGSGDYRFLASSNGGTSFSTKNFTIGVTGNHPNSAIDVAANSTDGVYAIWVDSTDIKFRASDDDGATFNTVADIGDSGPGSLLAQQTPDPQVVANGTNVYVVWQQYDGGLASSDIKFRVSTDGGTSFGTEIDLGNSGAIGPANSANPQIAIGTAGNVFVTWTDTSSGTGEIKYRRSTDSGASFETEINLSSSGSVDSSVPQIDASNDLVYVVWQEANNPTNGDDVYFKASSNNGTSFPTSFTDLSGGGTGVFSGTPQLAASKDKVFVVWQNKTGSAGDGQIKFIVGTGTETSITFNQTQYRISPDVALITIVDSDSNTSPGSPQSINIKVNSTTDDDGIPSLSLQETLDDSGIFTGTVTFTTGSTSGSVLQVTAGDTVSAIFNSVKQSATIFPRTIAFNTIQSPATLFTIDDITFVTVDDQNSNVTTDVETIDVTITSFIAGDSITLQLKETGIKTGIFGGSLNDNSLIFMNNHTTFPLDNSITLSQDNITNANAGAIDTTTVLVNSTTFPTGQTITLTETDVNTGIFEGSVTFISGTTTGTFVQASPGDYVQITYTGDTGSLSDRGLITPNTNQSRGALQIESSTGASDSITATYLGASTVGNIFVDLQGGESGGGGGGLVRPSLVLDFLGGATAGGGRAAPLVDLRALIQTNLIHIPDEIKEVVINFDPFTPLEPFDVTAEQFETFDFPFSIDNDGYALSGYSNTLVTKTLNTGEATKIKTVFYMSLEVEHVAFYTNMREGDSIDDSDAFLGFWKSKPDQFQTKDENGFFEYINLTIEENGIKKTATFDMKFLKPMTKSDIVLRMWDVKLHSTTILLFDAIEVIGPSIEQLEESTSEGLEIPEPGTAQPKTSELRIEEPPTSIPDWIKTSAKWWNNEQISDTGFARGIEYLIENNILKLPQTETFEQEQVQEIPVWIKNTAGWWGDGLLPDQDFVNGIQWLIKNGIMKIQINS